MMYILKTIIKGHRAYFHASGCANCQISVYKLCIKIRKGTYNIEFKDKIWEDASCNNMLSYRKKRIWNHRTRFLASNKIRKFTPSTITKFTFLSELSPRILYLGYLPLRGKVEKCESNQYFFNFLGVKIQT